jgi:hypothetical protein
MQSHATETEARRSDYSCAFLCVLSFDFAPLREKQFTLEAQSQSKGRKGLNG